MVKSRYHKKNKSNRRKSQRRRRQRGGAWYNPMSWGKDPNPPLSEDNIAGQQNNITNNDTSDSEQSVSGSDLSKEEPKLLGDQPSFFSKGSNDLMSKPNEKSGFFSFLGFGGGRRGRKSSHRSNLKRKL